MRARAAATLVCLALAGSVAWLHRGQRPRDGSRPRPLRARRRLVAARPSYWRGPEAPPVEAWPDQPHFAHDFACGRIDRVGPASEGGKYVCGLETLRAPCAIYTFGISGDSRFESHVANATPCAVHAFDPTIPRLPEGTHSGVAFARVGLGLETVPSKGPLKDFWHSGNAVAGLGALMAARNHTRLDVLKVDVEGSEYDVFGAWCSGEEAMPVFDVLLLETHGRAEHVAAFGRGGPLGACLRRRGFRLFQAEQNLRACACSGNGNLDTELAWIRADAAPARADAYDTRRQEARHRAYLAVRDAALARLAAPPAGPWRCSGGPAYFWDLFVPFHAGLAGGGAGSHTAAYDVAAAPFGRVAAEVARLEAQGWRLTHKHIGAAQCTRAARRSGSPGPARAHFHFVRLPSRRRRLAENRTISPS